MRTANWQNGHVLDFAVLNNHDVCRACAYIEQHCSSLFLLTIEDCFSCAEA